MDIKFFKEDLKFKLRVSGIVIDANKVLLEEYKDDTYCLPGGYVGFNETTEDAIKREMFEETKLKFEIIGFGGVIENFFTNKKKERTHEIDFYYYLNGSNIYENLDAQIIEKGSYSDIYHTFKWININELNDYKLLPNEIKHVIMNGKHNVHLIIKEN